MTRNAVKIIKGNGNPETSCTGGKMISDGESERQF